MNCGNFQEFLEFRCEAGNKNLVAHFESCHRNATYRSKIIHNELIQICVTRLMCSPLAGNFWSTPVLVHKGLIHGVLTSLPWQTGLQCQQSCTIALAHSVGYKWRSYQDSPSEGLISYMWIQSDSDLTGLINFQGVCVTRLMCSPLAGNFWSTPVLVHKGLIYGVMTSLPWQTGLQCWQSCTIALAHSVGGSPMWQAGILTTIPLYWVM